MRRFKIADENGLTLIEVVLGAAVMSFVLLLSYKVMDISQDVDTHVTESVQEYTSKGMGRARLHEDLRNSQASFNHVSDAQGFWTLNEDPARMQPLAWKLGGAGDGEFEIFRRQGGAKLFETKLFFPQQAYTLKDKKLSFSQEKFVKSFKNLGDNMAPGYYYFRATASVNGKLYSVITYFDGNNFKEVSSGGKGFYDFCKNADSVATHFMDKFFRCYPESGGISLLQVDALQLVKYTFRADGEKTCGYRNNEDCGVSLYRSVSYRLGENGKPEFGHEVKTLEGIKEYSMKRASPKDTQIEVNINLI